VAIPSKTLLQLRTLARQLSDNEHTDFVSDSELNTYINLGAQELYDIFAQAHGQEFFLKTFQIQVTAPVNAYTLPDDFHVLKGVDYRDAAFPESSTTEVFGMDRIVITTYDVLREEVADAVPLRPYMFNERHSGSDEERYRDTRLSRPRMRFRVFSEDITVDDSGEDGVVTNAAHRIRLQPVENGYILVWYIPVAPVLASDTDVLVGFHGYEEYPAIYAALRCARKAEEDWTGFAADLMAMRTRIEAMAGLRDMGHPTRVQDFEG